MAMGSYYTYLAGRIAGEVAVFYSQGPAVGDRSSILQTICTQQLVQNGEADIEGQRHFSGCKESHLPLENYNHMCLLLHYTVLRFVYMG
jgi:hypothetical protein